MDDKDEFTYDYYNYPFEISDSEQDKIDLNTLYGTDHEVKDLISSDIENNNSEFDSNQEKNSSNYYPNDFQESDSNNSHNEER